MQTEPRYDVIIVHSETGLVDSLAGEDMRLDSGFTNAERRLDTVSGRLNDHYHARIVLTGQSVKGQPAPCWYDETPAHSA